MNPALGQTDFRRTRPQVLSATWRKRLFWSLLLALHIVPLVAAIVQGNLHATPTGTADLLVRLVALSGSVGFFLLKIADVSWLQLRPGRNSWIASFCVVVLLHVNTIQRKVLDADTYSPMPIVATLAATGLVDPRAVRRAVRELTFQLRHASLLSSNLLPPARRWTGWSDTPRSLFDLAHIGTRASRAPPPCFAYSLVSLRSFLTATSGLRARPRRVEFRR